MSLLYAKEIMNLKLDPNHKHFPRLLSVKQQIYTNMMNLTARINGSVLRKPADDGLEDLLNQLKADGRAPQPKVIEPLKLSAAWVLGLEEVVDPLS